MINIWKYNIGDKVRIVDIDDGAVFIGTINAIVDSEECSDLEKQEDNVSIVTEDKRHISIYQSEIKSISLLSIQSNDARLASGK